MGKLPVPCALMRTDTIKDAGFCTVCLQQVEWWPFCLAWRSLKFWPVRPQEYFLLSLSPNKGPERALVLLGLFICVFFLPSNPPKSIMATLLFTFISEAENDHFKPPFMHLLESCWHVCINSDSLARDAYKLLQQMYAKCILSCLTNKWLLTSCGVYGHFRQTG